MDKGLRMAMLETIEKVNEQHIIGRTKPKAHQGPGRRARHV